jgi:hypothetical protein
MGKCPSVSASTKRRRCFQLANEIDAEGRAFDDPCRSCLLKGVPCLVSPKSIKCATCVRSGHGCSVSLSIRLSRECASLSDVEEHILSTESDLWDSVKSLGEALPAVQNAVSSMQRRYSKISDINSELVILRRLRASMRLSPGDCFGAPSSPAFSKITSITSVSDNAHG